MNEQLIVKNFGPIKDAMVDFKRVTVFIGPTGGGKSTLAKLATLLRDTSFQLGVSTDRKAMLANYRINNFLQKSTSLTWSDEKGKSNINQRLNFKHHSVSAEHIVKTTFDKSGISHEALVAFINHLDAKAEGRGLLASKRAIYVEFNKKDYPNKKIANEVEKFFGIYDKVRNTNLSHYIPSERIFVSSLEYSWAGLMRDDIGLAEPLLNFSNNFSLARKEISSLDIDFLNAKYIHSKGRDFIKVAEREKPMMLLEAASGIQSVTPLLVLLEHLSRNTEQAQSFIIEEPELNLYPTAQQGLLNWLVEKCTQGENDLTITTHSPYILSHLNLLLYAYQVAEKHPERAEEVAEVVPRASWINPKEFACYQVENGGVTSLVNDELGLIDDNGLDNLSGDAADAFDNLIRLSKGVARK